MSRPNPKAVLALGRRGDWESSWPSLNAIAEPPLATQTLRAMLEFKSAENHQLHHCLHRLVKSLPLPALLYNRKGRILTINQAAQSLLRGVEGKKTKWQMRDLWESLGWPPVPFSQWEWNGKRVSGWDCPLDGPDQSSGLHIRYVKVDEDPCDADHARRLASIGEKTGRLAHDIRNPLASMEWFATLLGREDHSKRERRELVDHLTQAIRSLDGLVSNLLMFSVPLQQERQAVNFSNLLDDVVLLAMFPIRKKRLTIDRHLDSPRMELTGHEQLLKQALLNLVLNAIHASSPDGHIEIQCRRKDVLRTGEIGAAPAGGVKVSIRDEGCGMSGDELNMAFQPFYSKRKGGTGLGLPIVKDIMHVHQGMINMISHQGKGTTVELFFPQ